MKKLIVIVSTLIFSFGLYANNPSGAPQETEAGDVRIQVIVESYNSQIKFNNHVEYHYNGENIRKELNTGINNYYVPVGVNLRISFYVWDFPTYLSILMGEADWLNWRSQWINIPCDNPFIMSFDYYVEEERSYLFRFHEEPLDIEEPEYIYP